MPYYTNKNILFIHIPKTGGTSLEEYLKKDDTEILFGENSGKNYLKDSIPNIYLHHQPYSVIYNNRKKFNITFDNSLKIITIVRNPYDKVVSDLFFLRLINLKSTPDDVYTILSKVYFVSNTFKYHVIPQHKYLLNENNKLINNITIFKTETLTDDLHKYGFTDFNIIKNSNNLKVDKARYMSYLNNNSVNLINKTYKEDFMLFNYEMKSIT